MSLRVLFKERPHVSVMDAVLEKKRCLMLDDALVHCTPIGSPEPFAHAAAQRPGRGLQAVNVLLVAD